MNLLLKRFFTFSLLCLVPTPFLIAQDAPPAGGGAQSDAKAATTATPSPAQAKPQPGELPPPDKRVFGVLPNYRTANFSAEYHPITNKQKITIALKDSFDYPLMFIGAGYAGLYQLDDSHPQFNQGLKGYLRRFGTSYNDQVMGNMLTEGILPIAFREDPRYFRLGEGTTKHRAFYALTRIFVTRTDSGGSSVNFAELVGNGISAGVGLSYYSDDRDFPDYLQNWGTALATDAVSQVLKEFWPDIKRRYFHHRKNDAPSN